MPIILFNGKSYNNLDELPPHERETYEKLSAMLVDKNGNGIPDFLEGDIANNVMSFYSGKSSINFNGQSYSSVDELSPEIREQVQRSFKMLSSMGITPSIPMTPNVQMPVNQTPSFPASTPVISREYSPTIQEESSSKPIVWIALAAVLGLLCLMGIVAAVAFVFLSK